MLHCNQCLHSIVRTHMCMLSMYVYRDETVPLFHKIKPSSSAVKVTVATPAKGRCRNVKSYTLSLRDQAGNVLFSQRHNVTSIIGGVSSVGGMVQLHLAGLSPSTTYSARVSAQCIHTTTPNSGRRELMQSAPGPDWEVDGPDGVFDTDAAPFPGGSCF